jgi:nucleoside-diphosphate-sugar epimerase
MILLTGANGFLGSSLAERIQTNVRCIVRHNINPSIASYNLYRVDSLSALTDWSGALNEIDIVIHLAGRAHVLDEGSGNTIDEYIRINTEATLHLANQAALRGVKRFIFLSSIGVNGDNSVQPFSEKDTPTPKSPYAISKLKAEEGLWEISRKTGLEIVIIRPPLVYAPNAPGNFGRLVSAVRSGMPLPFGAINNKRSLISINNLLDFIMLCVYHPKAANETFVISDGSDISTSNLLRLVARAMNKRVCLIPIPPLFLFVGGILVGKKNRIKKLLDNLQVDPSKAQNLLGWKPRLSTSDQILEMAEEFKNGHT